MEMHRKIPAPWHLFLPLSHSRLLPSRPSFVLRAAGVAFQMLLLYCFQQLCLIFSAGHLQQLLKYTGTVDSQPFLNQGTVNLGLVLGWGKEYEMFSSFRVHMDTKQGTFSLPPND